MCGNLKVLFIVAEFTFTYFNQSIKICWAELQKYFETLYRLFLHHFLHFIPFNIKFTTKAPDVRLHANDHIIKQ